jgi:hypothetical protein
MFLENPPDDRDKHPQKGRNELIADLIRRWTGDPVVRRKHISSHIQVLKAYVIEDSQSKLPCCIVSHTTNKCASAVMQCFGEPKKNMERMAAAGRERSRYHHRNLMTTPNRSHIQLRLPQLDSPISLRSQLNGGQYFEPKKFEMYVKDNQNRVVHCFTRFSSSQPRTADSSFASIDQSSPALLSTLTEDAKTSGLDCNLILAHASLAMTATSLSGAELSIEYTIRTQCMLAQYDKFECRTRFFTISDNPCIKHISEGNNVTKEIGYNHIEGLLTAIPFGSGFWAACALANVASKLREATRASQRSKICNDVNEALAMSMTVQRLHGEVKSSIAGLSAVQEIFASSRGRSRTRILVICWTFQQAENGQEGRTTWQYVRPIDTTTSTDDTSYQSLLPVYDIPHSDSSTQPFDQTMQHHPVSDLGSTFIDTSSYSHPTYFPDSQPQSYSTWPTATAHPDYNFQLCLDNRSTGHMFDDPSTVGSSAEVSGAYGIFESPAWHTDKLHPTHHSIAATYYASADAHDPSVGEISNSFDTMADAIVVDPSAHSEGSQNETYVMADTGHLSVAGDESQLVSLPYEHEVSFDVDNFSFGDHGKSKTALQHNHSKAISREFGEQQTKVMMCSRTRSPEHTQEGATERGNGMAMTRGL